MGKSIGAVQAAVMLLTGIFLGQKYHPSAAVAFLILASGLAGAYFCFLKGRQYKLDQLPKKLSRLFFCFALLAAGMVRTVMVSRERPSGAIENFADRAPVVFT